MPDPFALLPTAAHPAADRTLRAAVALADELLPGRAVAYYLLGSYRNGDPVPASDLDLLVVLRAGVPRGEADALARAMSLFGSASLISADVSVATEDELRRAGAVWLKDSATLVRGADVAATLPELAPAEYLRRLMHGAATYIGRLLPPGAALRAPLPPAPADPWLGLARPVRGPGGGDRPGTAKLVSCAAWAANALILAGGAAVLSGKGAVTARAYRRHVGDEWSDLLDDLSRRCRDEWGYLIPAAAADRATLRAVCARAYAFFDHFLTRYRAFLLSEVGDGRPARQLAVRRLAEIYSDAEARAVLGRVAAGADRAAEVAREVLATAAAGGHGPGSARPAGTHPASESCTGTT